jgi:hypothetical protein
MDDDGRMDDDGWIMTMETIMVIRMRMRMMMMVNNNNNNNIYYYCC